MAEGFVLNISKEMLQRLDAADKKIVQIGESAEKAMKKINEAFGKKLTGVEDFIKQLNDIQQQLSKKDLKVNVDLALKNGALDSLKKQIEALGITIPVGVTATGTGGGNSAGVVPNGLNEALSRIATTIDAMNKTLSSVINKSTTSKGNNSSSNEDSETNKSKKAIKDYEKIVNELGRIEQKIYDIKKAQDSLNKGGFTGLDTNFADVSSRMASLQQELTDSMLAIEEKYGEKLENIQTKRDAKELSLEQKQAKDKIDIQEKELNDLIKIEEQEFKEYERLMGKMLKLRKDINKNSNLIYSTDPKVSQDALAQIAKQEELLKKYEARAKTLENKHGASLSEIQIKYSQKELDMLNKAINNPNLNSGIDQKTKDLREYEKVLKRISDLEKIRDKASKAISKYGANSQIGQQANTIYQQAEQLLQRHNKRKIDLELQYGAELDSIKQAQATKELNYLIQQNNQEISEYERVRSKILEINKTLYENNKTLKNTKDPNLQAQINNQNQALLNERSKLATRQLELERKHGNSLLSVQTQIGQKEVEFERKKQQDKIREVQQALRRRQDIERRWAQRNARLTEQKRNTADGALSFSRNEAKTIGQKLQAIKYLQNAQKSLDVTTSQGRNKFNELNREIKKTENELRRCGVQMNNFQEKSRHLFDITGQLGRALSLMFSVSQITQYVSKMVNVRKEMELQQRSLQVLLQNKDKANELWNQTLDLAVKSPFRVKELVTYTKQLAAYRIESDKLFETNKMLADVSAGLGVDMQRLILAFGQVKSASFLRGTELRQFTEAGIPMLEELSKYFSEIYGKSVSVAEVFDMISKRMVTFADVEKVFQRMTGAGGVFFNMQEELSQTTAGLISNLQDSIDLMFNEIGKKNQGIINDVIKGARYIVDNWETVGKVMKGALVTLLLYKSATMDISKITKGLGANIKAAFSLLKENPLEFFQAFKGNIIMTALTAIIALVIKAVREHNKYKRAIEEVNKAHEKFRKSVSDVEIGFSEMFRNGNDNIDEYRDKLQELIGIAKQSYNIEIDFKVNELETIDEVSRKFDDLKEKILSFNQLSLEFSLDFVERDDRGWEWFQDYLGTDLKDLSASQKDMQSLASSIRGIISGTIKDVSELDKLNEKAESLTLTIQNLNRSGDTESANKVREEFNSIIEQITTLENKLKGVDIDIVKSLFPQGVDETEYEYIQRIQSAISDLQEESKKSGVFNVLGVEMSDRYDLANLNIAGRFKKYTDDLKEAEEELLAFYKSSHSDVANLVNLSLRGQTLGFNPLDLIDAIKEQNVEGIEDLEKIITKELTERGVNPTEEINKLLQKIVEADNESEVNEEFKNLVDILNKQSLEEEVSKYIYNGLKNIATQKEFDEATLHKMLKDAEKFYKKYQRVNAEGEVILETLDLDLIPKKEKATPLELKAWQKAYNEEVDEILNTLESSEDKAIFLPLKIRTDLQGVATTQDKQLATINEAIDTAQKELDRIEKQKTNLDAKLKSGEITKKQYEDLYTANIEKRKKLIEQLTQLRDLLGGDDEKSKGGKDTATQRIKDQISLIRQLYEEYQKLSKEMGATTAKGNVLSRFADYAKELGLNIGNIDFTNLQGIYNALQGLETSAESAGADAMKALTKAMGETSVELELMFYIDARNKFENQIKDMFSDYELSLELDKLNIPKNLASQLFGVDTVDLDDIKTALQNKLNELDAADISLTQQLEKEDINDNLRQSLLLQQKGNKELREQAEANLQKISDMEQKELEERLKTYTKYLLNEQHERVKIRMETLRMLQEVEDTKEYTPAQRQTITDKIKEEERKKLAQQPWKDFEQSPMYMQMFDDVENMGKGALESLITQMGTLKDELQSMGLPASDLKEILGAINKAEEELERRNPFKNFAKNAEIAFNRANKIRQLEEQRASQQEDYDIAKSQYDEYQDKLANAQDDLNIATLDIESEEYQNLVDKVEELTEEVNKWEKKVDETTSSLSNTNNQINDINDSSNDFYKQLQNVGTIAQSVSGGIWQIAEAIHGLPEETKETLDYLGKLEQGIVNIVGGILRIIYEDKISGIAQLVDGLFSTVALIIDWTSGARKANKEAERQSRILSDLQNKYDRLNEALDEAWNTQQIKEYNAELERNLQQQIVAQKQIVAAYEDVKGADEVGSVEWERLQEAKDELQNLYDMQQELQDNIYEKITGGIIDNTLDAISSWVDAWYDAFKETGDGLKGLEDNFNEMLLNLVKRQAVMKVAGRFIDQWNSVLERYVNNDDNLSLGEITSWANMIEQDLPALSSQLETFFKAFDGILGDTQGNLSGLQRGISSITESQADILASYANSCRFLLASIDTNLSQLASRVMSQTGGGENPMVEQLKIIAQQTSAINTLLNSLTAPHPTLSGRGLKVVI